MKAYIRSWFALVVLAATVFGVIALWPRSARAAGPWYVVQAASITVTTTTDELNSDGDCSLREAIQATNTDTAVDACPAGSGADTIIIPAGTYTLTIAGASEDGNTTGDLDITATLTLNGADMATTIINANALDRALHVPTAGVTLTVLNLTVRNGNVVGEGGGLYAAGSVVVLNTTFLSNTTGYPSSGGGAYFGGATTVAGATFTSNSGSGYGGGAYFNSAATVTGATFTSNYSYNSGGGVYFSGAAIVTGTTFISNTAAYGSGGGAVFSGSYNSGTLDNSTVSGNTSSAYSGGGGGGIYNAGTLTLNNSTISGNMNPVGDGSGIYNLGTLTLNNSMVSGNTNSGSIGGGISNLGALTLNNSTIRANTAGGGGGISNGGVLTLTNTTVDSNSVNHWGGGIWNFGTLTLNNSTVNGNTACCHHEAAGGGIFNDGNLTLNNSTISGNEASGEYAGYGGGIFSRGSLALNSSTVAGNTGSEGGISVENSATLRNTIIAGNTPYDCWARYGASGPTIITSGGYNLIENATGCNLSAAPGDLLNIDAKLGPFVGSPGYHPLLSDSPAINSGSPAGCTGSTGLLTTDQRGASRIGTCDIGAYEYTVPGPAASISAVGGTPQRTPPRSAFGTPLQAAVLDSLGSPVNNALVTFSAPPSGVSGTFGDSGTFTTTAVTNESGIATPAIFTANSLEGSYVVTATMGGVITPATFLLTNTGWYVATTGNDANNCQTPATPCATINGAIGKTGFVAGDTVLVVTGTYTSTDSPVVFLNKSARLLGGWNGAFTAQSGLSTIDGEGARRGMLVNRGVTAVIERFQMQNGYSGGIRSEGMLTLNDSVVISNTGEGIQGGTLIINNSNISGNSGVGIYGGITINNSTISGNTGGGIVGGPGTVNNSTISDNTGVGISNFNTLTINNSAITDNMGPGIANWGVNLTVNNSTISGNSTSGNGGGVLNTGDYSVGTVNLNNVTLANNTAQGDGGGLHNGGGTVNLKNTILAGNTDTGGQAPDCWGTLTSQGYNLIQSATGCTITGTVTGNVVGVDPNLGPLQDNGGPTFTHALLSGSPAIDAGNPATPGSGGNACEATDQRGVARASSRCDIGAYEFEGAQATASPSMSSTLTYTDTSSNTASVFIPSGAVTQTTALVYTPLTTTASTPSGFSFANQAFTLDAYQGGVLQSGFTFQQPITVTLTYTDATLGGLSENTLTLDYWTGSAWADAATTCIPTSPYLREPDLNRLSVAICHLSEFALFGQRQLFLPLVMK